MKKPTEAIERVRELYRDGCLWDYSVKRALAYIDSIPEWPADLTRERLEELARRGTWNQCTDAIFRLAAIAPKREKRKVELWNHETWADAIPPYAQYAGQSGLTDGVGGWRKVGEVEIDA